MPINPQCANVVAIFGGDAFERLEAMLRYYSTMLVEHGWQRFLFVLATPGDKTLNDLPQDLPQIARSRCHMGSGDPSTIVYQNTVDEIVRMYTGNRVFLHIICNDFKTARFAPEAPAKLIEILRGHTALTIWSFCYGILHPQDAQCMERQRQWVKSILDVKEVYPYLLSRTQDDGTLADEDHLWRALMCEILMISCEPHVSFYPISSLGYTSLNANEEELIRLRKHKLAQILQQACDDPYTPDQAWQDLMGINAPASPLPNATLQAVRAWLLERIKQDIPKPTPDQMRNFQTLCGVENMATPNELLGEAERLIEMNLGGLDERTNQTPPMRSANAYWGSLQSRLTLHLNLHSLPKQTLDQILAALGQLCQADGVRGVASPPYPAKKMLQSKRDYMAQCSELAMDAARSNVGEKHIPAYARAYGGMFTYLSKLLAGIRTIHKELDSQMLSKVEFSGLSQKYPAYVDAVNAALAQLPTQLFDGAHIYAFEKEGLRPSHLSKALGDVDKRLLAQMPPALTRSFIDAIQHMFNGDGQMDNFMNTYLDNARRLFRNPIVTAQTNDTHYFCNQGLADSPWCKNNAANNISLVNNDNVERLDRFDLSGQTRYGDLDDYIAEENAEDGINIYFRTQGNAGQLPSLQPAPAQEAPAAQTKPEEPPKPAATPPASKLRLTEMNGRYYLQWHWDPAFEFYDIKVNGTLDNVTRQEYSTQGSVQGKDITKHLKPGKNHIELFTIKGQLIAEDDFCGPQTPIHYRKVGNDLHIDDVSDAAFGELAVREITGQGKTCFYYPLRPLRPKNSQLGKTPVHIYKDLSFRSWDLVSDPANRFCRYKPKHKPKP